MIRKTGLLVVLLISLTAGSASAALLPPVTVSGLEWLQPVDFIGYSWNDINTVCDASSGSCNGSLGGNDLTGWTWASVDNVNGLFNYYLGSTALGPGPDNLIEFGNSWIFSMTHDGFLLTTPQEEFSRSAAISAIVRTLDFDGNPYLTLMVAASAPPSTFVQWAYTDRGTLKGNQDGVTGSWFVRNATASSVPITNTLALMALGLCALGITTRHRIPSTAVGVQLC